MRKGLRPKLIQLVIWLAGAALIIWQWKVLCRLAVMLGLAAILAFLLEPMTARFSARMPRTSAAALAFLIFFGAIGALLAAAGPAAVRQIRELMGKLPEYTSQLEMFAAQADKWAESILPGMDFSFSAWAAEKLMQSVSSEGFRLDAVAEKVPQLLDILLAPAVAFYILRDWHALSAWFYRWLPQERRAGWRKVIQEIFAQLRAYIRSQVLVCAAVGVISAVFLAMLGVPYAFFSGLIAMAGNLIPYFGPVIAAVPVLLLVLLARPDRLIWAVIALAGAQQVENLLISPVITGGQLRLHPAVVMVLILAGGKAFGIWGMTLAVPAALILRTLTQNLWNSSIRYQRYEE